MKTIRPCDYAPEGAPCPTHGNGTWPDACVCESQRKRNLKIVRTGFLIFFTLAFLLLAAIAAINADPACMTQSEARDKWPRSHLWWHGLNHCWDNTPSRRIRRMYQDPVPKRVMAMEPKKDIVVKHVDPAEFNELDAQADSDTFFNSQKMPLWPPIIYPHTLFTPWDDRIGGTLQWQRGNQ